MYLKFIISSGISNLKITFLIVIDVHTLFFFSETSAVDSIVFWAQANDPDDPTHPHGKLEYSIVGGDVNGQLMVDTDTGIVRVASQLGCA